MQERNYRYHQPANYRYYQQPVFDNRRGGPYQDFIEEQPEMPQEDTGIVTDRDLAILKDLDLWEDECSRADSADLIKNGVETITEDNPMQKHWRSDKERSREHEKRAVIETNFDELISCSPVRKSVRPEENSPEQSVEKRKRLRKDKEIKVVLEDDIDSEEEVKKGKKKYSKKLNHLSKEKMDNLRRLTGGDRENQFKRANSESTKPSLDVIMPKDFDNKESFARRFKVIESLGEGGSSIVRKVACRKDGKICAVKSCKSNDSRNTKYIRTELKFLKMLAHPNIIKPYGIFESTSNVQLN